ncbi:hypothetical protein [Kitasatospora sp. MAP5-34]|uniref:hypothetical protein n=1 Tax=Kitasatospora sp. MAP5-34 TaxID=3035102 RepID=UPI002474A7EE|nr:hypothetical protein [Kitasatospora sp. MAP5-34]MDH6580226.1 hypothetical protein [Kitasatospora sp. MAP5-34]
MAFARLGTRGPTAAVVLLLLALCGLAGAGPAAAHGVSQSSDLELAGSFGGNELTFVLRQVARVPGPVRVDVIAHDPVRAAELKLSLTPQDGLPATDRPPESIQLAEPGTQSVTLHVDRTGPWELDVTAGQETARLPFRVLVPQPAPWENVAYPALLVAGVALLAVFGSAVLGRRRIALTLVGAVAVALTAALTAGLLSPDIPPARAQGSPDERILTNVDGTTANGRSFTELALTTAPAAPVAGLDFALHLHLTDGASGTPVDDLAVHHGALAHTVVTSADCKYFRHLHPVPIAPGELLLHLTVPEPGRYLVQTELDRVNSGSQLLTATVDVGGTAPAPQAHPADAQDSAQDAQVTLNPAQPTAGVPTELTLHVGSAQAPANDLQGWLGMAGHLIVRRPGSEFFGHVHETASMAALNQPNAVLPDETVGQYGPLLHFVFAFPAPGRYQVWIQYERDFRIHTVALTVDVSGAAP